MTSTPRTHAHMRTCPARPDARPGAHRAPAFRTATTPHKATHICACALKRKYAHAQTALKSPRHCRERPVAGLTNDAGLQGRPERHLEVDRALLTCARGWKNGHGGNLGVHADELDVLGEATNADLESWCLCVTGKRNLGGCTWRSQSSSPSRRGARPEAPAVAPSKGHPRPRPCPAPATSTTARQSCREEALKRGACGERARAGVPGARWSNSIGLSPDQHFSA